MDLSWMDENLSSASEATEDEDSNDGKRSENSVDATKNEVVEKCHFVPLKSVQRAFDYCNDPSIRHQDALYKYCKRSILDLQWRNKGVTMRHSFGTPWYVVWQKAVAKAVYNHDWNNLLYLLKKSPITEHQAHYLKICYYYRALAILLMYHPRSQSQGVLNDFLHMYVPCRSDEDKKAMLKVLLTLPNKLLPPRLERGGKTMTNDDE